jgi:hypothetical protein
VTVALLAAGVDGGQLDGDGGGRLLQRVLDDDVAGVVLEGAADLGHQVPDGEGDLAVRGVDRVGTGDQAGDGVGRGAGGDGLAHGFLSGCYRVGDA